MSCVVSYVGFRCIIVMHLIQHYWQTDSELRPEVWEQPNSKSMHICLSERNRAANIRPLVRPILRL